LVGFAFEGGEVAACFEAGTAAQAEDMVVDGAIGACGDGLSCVGVEEPGKETVLEGCDIGVERILGKGELDTKVLKGLCTRGAFGKKAGVLEGRRGTHGVCATKGFPKTGVVELAACIQAFVEPMHMKHAAEEGKLMNEGGHEGSVGGGGEP